MAGILDLIGMFLGHQTEAEKAQLSQTEDIQRQQDAIKYDPQHYQAMAGAQDTVNQGRAQKLIHNGYGPQNINDPYSLGVMTGGNFSGGNMAANSKSEYDMANMLPATTSSADTTYEQNRGATEQGRQDSNAAYMQGANQGGAARLYANYELPNEQVSLTNKTWAENNIQPYENMFNAGLASNKYKNVGLAEDTQSKQMMNTDFTAAHGGVPPAAIEQSPYMPNTTIGGVNIDRNQNWVPQQSQDMMWKMQHMNQIMGQSGGQAGGFGGGTLVGKDGKPVNLPTAPVMQYSPYPPQQGAPSPQPTQVSSSTQQPSNGYSAEFQRRMDAIDAEHAAKKKAAIDAMNSSMQQPSQLIYNPFGN